MGSPFIVLAEQEGRLIRPRLCYVAAGRFDGFWELKLNPWDVAAGKLLVEEAGGIVTDFRGNPADIYGQEILATNGKVHQEMIKVLQRG